MNNKDNEGMKYYYYHPESDTVYSSDRPPEKEIINTCPVSHIDKDFAMTLKESLGLKEIPHVK